VRWAATILAATLVYVFPASGDAARLQWPLRPPPAVMRAFDAPSPNWNRGHRGVDLAGSPGQPVYAAGAATSVTAGTAIGELLTGHPGCPVAACLHWGAMWGPAARADYVDPLGLLTSTPIRLKPLHR
jgi:hypothetical protein